MTPEPETPQPFIIYLVVPCPDCAASAMQPCLDEGIIVGDDVHLGRYELFAAARITDPPLGLKDLMTLQVSEYQPE